MSSAGSLTERITVQQRAVDDNNDRAGPWQTFYECAAEITPLLGSEPVVASRLLGEQPLKIVIRASALARQIDGSFRALNPRSPSVVYDIRSASTRPTRDFVDLLCVWKVGQPNG